MLDLGVAPPGVGYNILEHKETPCESLLQWKTRDLRRRWRFDDGVGCTADGGHFRVSYPASGSTLKQPWQSVCALSYYNKLTIANRIMETLRQQYRVRATSGILHERRSVPELCVTILAFFF